jgi:hypothetical protein
MVTSESTEQIEGERLLTAEETENHNGEEVIELQTFESDEIDQDKPRLVITPLPKKEVFYISRKKLNVLRCLF